MTIALPKAAEISVETPTMKTDSMNTVLVVDDEPQIRRALSLNLGAKSVRGVGSHDRRSCCCLVRSRDPDVVLLDLGLPDMDGIEVCNRSGREVHVSVIVLTVARRTVQSRGVSQPVPTTTSRNRSTWRNWQIALQACCDATLTPRTSIRDSSKDAAVNQLACSSRRQRAGGGRGSP